MFLTPAKQKLQNMQGTCVNWVIALKLEHINADLDFWNPGNDRLKKHAESDIFVIF